MGPVFKFGIFFPNLVFIDSESCWNSGGSFTIPRRGLKTLSLYRDGLDFPTASSPATAQEA